MRSLTIIPFIAGLVACGGGPAQQELPCPEFQILDRCIQDGQDGSDGQDGTNGKNALIDILDQVDGGGASCNNGGFTLLAGIDLNDNSDLDLSEITQSKDVCNGVDGQDGQDAPTNDFDVVELIDPCGEETNFDEVLIRLANDQIIASFSENKNGKNTRFVVLNPGTYQTTDGTNCVFTVDSNLNVSW